MNHTRILRILLLAACIVHVTWSLNYERDPQFLRRSRRIALSEYLLPPPPPSRNHAPGRTGRFVAPQLAPQPPQPQAAESQGYLSRLMGWLNPFSTPPSYPLAPPPLPKHPQPQHPPSPFPPYPIYPPLTDPRPVGPSGPYNAPPQHYPKHPPPGHPNNYHRPKNCNACNKVPWVPMQNAENYRKEPSYAGTDNQWNQNNPAETYDSHHASSQEVRAPDFTHSQYRPNLQLGPLPNPQLYPGPMPPLYKAGVFAATGPQSAEGNHFHEQSLPSEAIGSNSYPQVEHGWHLAQQQQQFPGKHNDRDLAASGSQVDQGQSKIEDPNYHDPVPSSAFENILDYDSRGSGPSGSHQALQFDNRNNDLPPTVNTLPPSSVTTQIHFEESPLLDLTKDDDGQENLEQIFPTDTPRIKLEQFSGDFATVTANYYAGNENDLHRSQLDPTTVSYIPPDHDALGLASSLLDANFSNADAKPQEPTSLSSLVGGRRNHFYVPPPARNSEEPPSEAQEKLLKNDSADSRNPRTGSQYSGQTANLPLKNANGATRSKQVQVIIPYTSQYTPLPFQPSFNEWSINYNIERTQPRKVPPLIEPNHDKYLGQESRPATNRANGTIDVHRLQKNIDNWTIQEYSSATTASTLLPSSSHPYLLPSKKIPDEYLTTTEPVNPRDKHTGSNEIVKVYSLGGFSFNDVEHEGSASDHAEQSVDPGTQDREQTNSTNIREDVYVVTPLPVRITTQALAKGHPKHESKGEASKKATSIDSKKSKASLDKFDAIERAYQVLPQAVNNLAVASTGKEDVPLWGIMEHEEFAALQPLDDKILDKDVADGPVLYSGHSKVSHARRR